MSDELTERIATAISDADMFKGTVLALAGMNPDVWRQRARTGQWKRSEVAAIAGVLRVPVEKLVGSDS